MLALTVTLDSLFNQEGRHGKDQKPSVFPKKGDNLASRASKLEENLEVYEPIILKEIAIVLIKDDTTWYPYGLHSLVIHYFNFFFQMQNDYQKQNIQLTPFIKLLITHDTLHYYITRCRWLYATKPCYNILINPNC